MKNNVIWQGGLAFCFFILHSCQNAIDVRAIQAGEQPLNDRSQQLPMQKLNDDLSSFCRCMIRTARHTRVPVDAYWKKGNRELL
jgi:hypothetical protein